jgi:multicomponent K+:H+ antiporter subunit A/multicomponent Na+:H+ antiporter subunit A
MPSLLLIALLAPWVAALAMPALGARLGPRTGLLALLAPLTSLAALIALLAGPAEARETASWSWVPALGVNLSFTADGLALFYGLVVCGVGVGVVAYAAAYLDNHYRDHGRFYCYLLVFMGAMLGTVFSSNLLVLFVAWELTGLSSFLLIGFLHEKEESRRGARMALLTTGLTGLALLAGVVLLRLAYGSYELGEILARIAAGPADPANASLVTAAFLCCFVGIAGKSALFPFHYWLPNAMAAPTPVSAYLHSATMVKLGVFLTARLLPVFNDLPAWTPLLVLVGFGTLLLGAVLALLSQDLKGVLAYTTVAQLGLLVGHYGLHASGAPVAWDYVHILNHVFYKAGLFMIVGIIDHSTGSRDLRSLGGLAKKMPLTAVAAALTLASLAGLPLTTGFLSKEMLLKTLTGFWTSTGGSPLAAWALSCVLLASALKVAIALGVWKRAFAGPPGPAIGPDFHAPSFALQLPPLVFAAAALGFGIAAGSFGAFADLFLVDGTHRSAASLGGLHLWHGFTLELGLSALVVASGIALYAGVGRIRWANTQIPRGLRLDAVFDPLVEGVQKSGKVLNRLLGFEKPYAHLYVIVGVIVATLGVYLATQSADLRAAAADWSPWPHHFGGFERWVLVALIGGAALTAAAWKNPLKQVIALCVTGLGITVYFVLYAAPDLAITQLLVETATLLLVLFVVLRFKRDAADSDALVPMTRWPRAGRVLLAAVFGLLIGGGVLIFQSPNSALQEKAGSWYLAQTVPLAQGSNAVNTVVIDFRGWDTFLEIAVLLIAALGCLGLLHRARRESSPSAAPAPDSAASAAAGAGDLFPVPRDLILRMVAIGGFLPLNAFALHLFLRGHNAPGGGFAAGLVTALSLLLLTFAIGVHGVRRILKINPVVLAIAGLLLALAMAVAPMLRGLPLFSHFHAYVLGGFYVGAAFWFDLGVYLTVVGTVLKLILPLMKSVHALPAFVSEEEDRFAERLSEPIDLAHTRKASPRKEPLT